MHLTSSGGNLVSSEPSGLCASTPHRLSCELPAGINRVQMHTYLPRVLRPGLQGDRTRQVGRDLKQKRGVNNPAPRERWRACCSAPCTHMRAHRLSCRVEGGGAFLGEGRAVLVLQFLGASMSQTCIQHPALVNGGAPGKHLALALGGLHLRRAGSLLPAAMCSHRPWETGLCIWQEIFDGPNYSAVWTIKAQSTRPPRDAAAGAPAGGHRAP